MNFRCRFCIYLVTLCVVMYFLWLKDKTRSRVKAGVSYTSEHCCLLQLTLIPGRSCLPLQLRKSNLLPCHCYNNLQLLDTSLSMTVSQNPCHTHLGQAVFLWYIFISPSCRADFQSLLPLRQLRARQHKGEELDVALLPALAFPDLIFFFLPEQNSLLVMVVTASFCALILAMCQTQNLFKVCPYSSFLSLQNSSAFSNSVRFLRAFWSQFQVLHSFASFYLLILILPNKPAFRSPLLLTKWFSCIFQYHFACTAYHSWIIHKALVSSHLSSAFIMKVCSISGSEKGQLG